MKAPAFWNRPESALGTILSPLACAYGLASRFRRATTSATHVDARVICIGNLVAGGAGKTPTAIAVAGLLDRDDIAFLTRGYRGRLKGPVRVDPAQHTAADVGDEPLLLARAAPTWLARDRVAGAKAAAAAGSRILIMDDGHQNPSLVKDVAIVVVDGTTGFGNGRVMPAGPLRESVADGLSRADAVIVVGEDHARVAERLPSPLAVFGGQLVPTLEAERLSGRRVVAFAGIGRPGKFFRTLSAMGCDVVASRSFADHHAYRPEEIMAICEEAAARDAVPVTTEKDAVRLPEGARDMVETLPVRLEWEDPGGLARFLAERLG